MRKIIKILFVSTLFLISCGTDRMEEITGADNFNGLSLKGENKRTNIRLLVNEQNKCGGGIDLPLDNSSPIPYYSGFVYFWNYDESLYSCKGCKDLPSLIVDYINNNYNPSPIDFKFLPNDPNYPTPWMDFNAVDASGYLELDVFQTVIVGIPSSYWDFPEGSPLQPDVLNAILQNVMKEIVTAGNGRRVNAIRMYYDTLSCSVGEEKTNGLTIQIKYK